MNSDVRYEKCNLQIGKALSSSVPFASSLSAWSINQEKGENYRIARNLSKVSRETLGGEKGDDHCG